MYVTCEKCGKCYDDAQRWTICPHPSLEYHISAYTKPEKPVDPRKLLKQLQSLKALTANCAEKRAAILSRIVGNSDAYGRMREHEAAVLDTGAAVVQNLDVDALIELVKREVDSIDTVSETPSMDEVYRVKTEEINPAKRVLDKHATFKDGAVIVHDPDDPPVDTESTKGESHDGQ